MNKNTVYSLRILTSTFLPHLSCSLVQNFVGPLAPFLQESLSITRTQIGMLISIQHVGQVAMAIPAGAIVERVGIRIWLFFSPFFLGLCALYFACAKSFIAGVVIFLLGGFMYAFINPATTKAILLGFAQERRGTAIGIKHTGTPAGSFIAAAVLPAAALAYGWEWSIILVAVISILVGLFGWLLYQERENNSVGEEAILPQQSNAKEDIFKLLRNTDFLLTSGLQAIFVMSLYIIQAYLVLYLVEFLGYSKVYAGFVMAAVQLIGAISRIGFGMVSDFIFDGRRVPVLQIMGFITVIGLVGLGFLNAATPSWITFLAASLAGGGSTGFMGTAVLLRAELAGKHLVATSTGMGMAIAASGILLGPPLFGFIVDSIHSYRIAWEAIALLNLVSTLLLRFIHEPVGKEIQKGF
ncbi:MAG: hypothetical protein PWP65_1248 [Clostridia bacterium]|nr:hypothetical protein [Clostridia bacterium]